MSEAVASESHAIVELHDVAARWRAPLPPASPSSRNSNVVLFPLGGRDGAPARRAPEVSAAERPAPRALPRHHWLRWAALLLISAAAHAAFYVPFGAEEPPPMASVGEVAISVELVLGANQDAGLVPDGGVSEASTPPPAQAPEVSDKVVEKPPEKPEEKPLDKPTELKEKKAEPQEKAAPAMQVAVLKPAEQAAPPPPAMPLEPVTAQAPSPAQIQAVPLTQTGGELLASVNPEQSTELKVVEVPPDPLEEKPVLKKPEKKIEEKRRDPPPMAVRGERNNIKTMTAASTAAGGVGRGSSDADSNYRGRIAAQLSRHKRYPAEARSRQAQGTAAITFSIDETGKVTTVTLVRASGVASLDQEAVAMVRRASPFPAPPGGRAMTFAIPVTFKLH